MDAATIQQIHAAIQRLRAAGAWAMADQLTKLLQEVL